MILTTPSLLPTEVLLITDELLAPADFLLHRYLTTHLKEGSDSPVVLVSFSEDIGRWKALASRSNVNLATHLDLGSVIFIDVTSQVAPTMPEGHPTLREVYDNIRSILATLKDGSEKPPLIILDDLASMEWMGLPIDEIVRFARALCGMCRKHASSLILRHHITTPDEPDELLKRLLQMCHYHLDVFPLSSGRSGSVSGQIALHCGPAAAGPVQQCIPRSGAAHYRLTDSGCIFFDRGTGNGVL
ncbi:hypothetical protein C8Q80DRAFT_1237014 [Daedaleopsis nitida]|nr:hypothetical protein C8Q80DRAFT_1237014 [Daedaleopsis nitida]